LLLSRAIAHVESANFPVAYCGLKIITSLSLRFPDFQRMIALTIKCRLKMSQRLAARQLGIKHGDKLIPATQLSHSVIALVAFDCIFKPVFWDKA
jgi:hypothetical protein